MGCECDDAHGFALPSHHSLTRVCVCSCAQFWHGHKRFPQSTEFNPDQPEHVDYIYHGANILASVFKLPEQSKEAVKAMLPKLVASGRKWEPSGAKISLDGDPSNPNANQEKKPDVPSEEDHAVVARLTHELRALDLAKFTPLVSADFEKVGVGGATARMHRLISRQC